MHVGVVRGALNQSETESPAMSAVPAHDGPPAPFMSAPGRLIENDGPSPPAVALDRRGTVRLLCRARPPPPGAGACLFRGGALPAISRQAAHQS